MSHMYYAEQVQHGTASGGTRQSPLAQIRSPRKGAPGPTRQKCSPSKLGGYCVRRATLAEASGAAGTPPGLTAKTHTRARQSIAQMGPEQAPMLCWRELTAACDEADRAVVFCRFCEVEHRLDSRKARLRRAGNIAVPAVFEPVRIQGRSHMWRPSAGVAWQRVESGPALAADRTALEVRIPSKAAARGHLSSG